MAIELSADELAKAETMSLIDLRQRAVDEMNGTTKDTTKKEKTAVARDEQGRFASAEADDIDNSSDLEADTKDDDAEQQVSGEPTSHIARKEIDLGDGSGVQVFTGDGVTREQALEDLADKLAEAQKNASKKIRELSSRVKTQTAADQQSDADLEYVIGEKLKKNPKQTIKDVVTETIKEQQDALQRSQAVQEQFVATHTDYKKTLENGRKMSEWVQLKGYQEFTAENLEKAYQDLKKSGLLVLQVAGADDATDVDDEDTQRIAEDQSRTTQQRSQKKGSTINTRSRSTTTRVSTTPSDDELYTMPMDKLRNLANKQMSDRRE